MFTCCDNIVLDVSGVIPQAESSTTTLDVGIAYTDVSEAQVSTRGRISNILRSETGERGGQMGDGHSSPALYLCIQRRTTKSNLIESRHNNKDGRCYVIGSDGSFVTFRWSTLPDPFCSSPGTRLRPRSSPSLDHLVFVNLVSAIKKINLLQESLARLTGIIARVLIRMARSSDVYSRKDGPCIDQPTQSLQATSVRSVASRSFFDRSSRQRPDSLPTFSQARNPIIMWGVCAKSDYCKQVEIRHIPVHLSPLSLQNVHLHIMPRILPGTACMLPQTTQCVNSSTIVDIMVQRYSRTRVSAIFVPSAFARSYHEIRI